MLSSERISVVVAAEGRHLFDAIHDPRIQVVQPADHAQPDLVVFPCSRHRRFDNLTALVLPDPLRASIAAGHTGLVFDTSLEGVAHKPDITAALHAVIAQLGATPAQCVYVTQDRQYEGDYRAYCASNSLAPVSVLTHDYWIWYALSPYESEGAGLFSQALEAFHARSWLRACRFVSLNRTPRPSKVLFLLCVLRDRLWDEGFISFGGFRRKPGVAGKDRPTVEELQRTLPGFEDLVAELAPFIDPLDRQGRVLLGLEQHGWDGINLTSGNLAVDLAECERSWFTIVTETEMRPRPSRITEKVVKPLVNFHPFLLLGNPGALAMIRSYGFETFGEVFDESYDEVLEPRQRFERVYNEFVRACRRPDREWADLTKRVDEKLVFNARWAMTGFPAAYRRQRDAALVDRVVEAVRPSHR